MKSEDELLDRDEAANLCRFSKRTLDRQTDLPRIKLTTRRVVYRRSDLLAWIEAKAAAHRAAYRTSRESK